MFEAIKNAVLYGKDFCEDTAENIRETVVTAVDCAKLHYRIVSKRNELNALYALLGKEMVGSLDDGDDEVREDEMNKLCERISGKEEILKGLLDQYRIVCGKVICPDCGKFMSEKYSFCPYCGNRMSDICGHIESDVDDEELEEVRETEDIL